ncbi:MAG: D-hexose-6-phosphate mutarotase [Anaerolineae bacterium]
MTDISALNARYGTPGQLTVKAGPGDLAMVEVANAQASATLALQGAQVLQWAPLGQQPVIWLSGAARYAIGKSIRGGIPLCWPWFGPHPSEADFPAHGFARTSLWEIVDTQVLADGATRIGLRLKHTDASRALWPHAAELECQISVAATLEIDLLTRNTGSASITIGQALHTYFAVSDVRRIRIEGLEGCHYLDKVDGGRRKEQMGPVSFVAETDRTYLDTAADCLIDDPGLARRIRIHKRGSRSTVVWNPWIEKATRLGDLGADGWLHMVCVESANAADDVVTVPPGAEHRLEVRYTLESR